MKKVTLFLHIATFTLFMHTIQAQSWELGLGLSAMNYQGDVVPSLFTLKGTKPNFGIFARHNFEGDKLGLRFGLNFGKLAGNDADYTDPSWRQTRKFSFSTPVTEVSALLEWNILGIKNDDGSARKVVPYLFGGLGLAFTNPTVNFNESGNTSMASAIAADKSGLKKTALVIPFGVGLKFPMPKGTLGLEFGLRPTTSDYIDGISQAGNPNKRDWYAVGGINYGFRFGGGGGNKKGPSVAKDKDSDGDGIVDMLDKCPDIPGLATNSGCPGLSQVDQKTIIEAVSNINFKTGSADLTAESLPIMDRIADILTRNPYYNVSVEGHTDSQGNETSNLSLSKARAATCVNYLQSKGITASRMTSNGFGSSRPIAPNDTEEGRRRNRRVEFNLAIR